MRYNDHVFYIFHLKFTKFFLAKLVPEKRLKNGDDFDAKIVHDSDEIYGLSMIYSIYVV